MKLMPRSGLIAMRRLWLAAIPAVALAGCTGLPPSEPVPPSVPAMPSSGDPYVCARGLGRDAAGEDVVLLCWPRQADKLPVAPGEVYPPWANAEWERIMRGEARLVPDSAYAPEPPIPPRPPIADNSEPQQLPDAGQPDTRDDAAPEPPPRRHSQPPVIAQPDTPDPPVAALPRPSPPPAPPADVEARENSPRSAPPSSPAEPCNSWWDPCHLWQ